MTDQPPKPRRRSARDAKRRILDAAEERLVAGGPDAVRVQLVAADLGLTDAAIHYHFGNREGLMTALLRRCGVRLKAELAAACERAVAGEASALPEVARQLDTLYRQRQLAQLALWLIRDGWQPEGEGGFLPLAEALEATRCPDAARDPDDSRYVVALLNLVMAAMPLIGAPFLASVGLPRDEGGQARFREWLVALLDDRCRPREPAGNHDPDGQRRRLPAPGSQTMIHTGACGCGTCRLEVETARPLAEISPRVCDCDYCRQRPAAAVFSGTDVAIAVSTDAPGLTVDRQGDGLAGFYRCPDCDDLLAVGCPIDGEWRGAVNAWLIAAPAAFAAVTPIQPRLLGPHEKVARWRTLWGRLRLPARVTAPG